MKAVDIIIKHIEESGISQNEAARMAGMSRQNFWDKLNKGNPRFNSMERIMAAFGYEIIVKDTSGEDPGFDAKSFFETVRAENPSYDMLDHILEAMDVSLIIQKKPENGEK